MVNELEEKQRKKTNPFLWFLYVVFIPLLFAITVALIICTVAGVNVFDAAKDFGQKIPIVGNLIPKDESKSTKISEKDLIDLQGIIKDREAQISELNSKIDDKNNDIQRAELENKRLQQEIDDLTANAEESKVAYKDIIKTYETMSPKKVGPIIIQMNDKEAVKVLSSVKAETLAAILENMDAKNAAKYTELLANGTK